MKALHEHVYGGMIVRIHTPAEGCTSQRCLTRARAHAAELDAKLVVTKASPA